MRHLRLALFLCGLARCPALAPAFDIFDEDGVNLYGPPPPPPSLLGSVRAITSPEIAVMISPELYAVGTIRLTSGEAVGDLLTRGTGRWELIAIGTENQILAVNGGVPAWINAGLTSPEVLSGGAINQTIRHSGLGPEWNPNVLATLREESAGGELHVLGSEDAVRIQKSPSSDQTLVALDALAGSQSPSIAWYILNRARFAFLGIHDPDVLTLITSADTGGLATLRVGLTSRQVSIDAHRTALGQYATDEIMFIGRAITDLVPDSLTYLDELDLGDETHSWSRAFIDNVITASIIAAGGAGGEIVTTGTLHPENRPEDQDLGTSARPYNNLHVGSVHATDEIRVGGVPVLTSEADTLASVTARGATTADDVTLSGNTTLGDDGTQILTVSGDVVVNTDHLVVDTVWGRTGFGTASPQARVDAFVPLGNSDHALRLGHQAETTPVLALSAPVVNDGATTNMPLIQVGGGIIDNGHLLWMTVFVEDLNGNYSGYYAIPLHSIADP